MNINNCNIELKKQDKILLRNFFSINIEWLKNNDLSKYPNIEVFGNMYEKFIDETNLRNNDILMLFLAEIRYEQLSQKITNDKIGMRVLKNCRPFSKSGLVIKNEVILKWYRESNIVHTVSRTDLLELNRSIEPKLKQNSIVREKSLKELSKKIIR